MPTLGGGVAQTAAGRTYVFKPIRMIQASAVFDRKNLRFGAGHVATRLTGF
jgi:hypothetical protein